MTLLSGQTKNTFITVTVEIVNKTYTPIVIKIYFNVSYNRQQFSIFIKIVRIGTLKIQY